MKLTKGQIDEARSGGKLSIHKWSNDLNETNTMGVVPYSFDKNIIEDERNVVRIILERFNKDLKGCLIIR
jgi:hypothetical protein